jgi:hypothetical protein
MDRRGGFNSPVVRSSNDKPAVNDDVPWALLIAVVVLCTVLIIVLPVMGLMYMDMYNATNKAIIETRKIKELRLQMLKER